MDMKMKPLFSRKPKAPQKTRDQIILDLDVKLRLLENSYKVIIERELRALRESRSYNKDNPRAVNKIKNAYYSLGILRQARDELRDIQSAAELAQTMNEMGNALKALNRLSGKSETVNVSLINRGIAKMNRNADKKDGGMGNVYSKSIHELVDDDVIDRLVRGESIQECMNRDRNEMADMPVLFGTEDLLAGDMNLEKELSDTLAYIAALDS